MRILWAALFIALGFMGAAQATESLSTINQTQKFRCGYVEYQPALTKDMTDNTWHGFDYDVIQAVASRLELTADFATPTGWATVVADLNANKFDVLCSGFWVHPNVGKFALFSRPIFYQPVFVVARQGDARFDSVPVNLNDEALQMVALEGDNPVNIAKADFPKARVLALPNMTDFSQVLVSVADGKADFTIVDAVTFGVYNASNPNRLRIVDATRPIRIYPVSYVFKANDVVLRDAFNAALDEMILDKTLDRIIDKYDRYPNAYYRATVSYRNPYLAKR